MDPSYLVATPRKAWRPKHGGYYALWENQYFINYLGYECLKAKHRDQVKHWHRSYCIYSVDLIGFATRQVTVEGDGYEYVLATFRKSFHYVGTPVPSCP